MFMAKFRLEFSYPDGHLEVIENDFDSLEEAKEFGDNLYNQVLATERFHKRRDDDGDIGYHKPGKAYYYVTKRDGNNRTVVFDSRIK